MQHSRRDFLIAAGSLAAVGSWATAGAPGSVPLRLPVDPHKALHVQGGDALTLPEDLDKIITDADLVATMRKYGMQIVADCSGGGMRGTPTAAQKTGNMRNLTKLVADGLIGRIAC